MIIDFYNRNGGGGGSTDLSGVVASADLSGTTLNFENNSGTTIDSVELSGITGDATVLEPKTAIPESGVAGTVIALNKPDEEGWTSFIIGSGKSRTQISYYVESSENPNPDLSLRPTRYEITVAYANAVDENGNYNYGNSTTVELSVDYEGNITFTNLGNFSQSGDIYSLVADIYNTSTGENIQKTLYMSLENGYLYFNNGQGDCPYDITGSQYYYWQDMGYWDYDPETGEPTTWNESWNEMSNYATLQSWGIASPAKIGIYQANSANTYVDYASQIPVPTEVEKAQKLKTYPNGTDFDSITFEGGDVISVEGWGRPAYINNYSTGLNDARQIAFADEVQNLDTKIRNIDTNKYMEGFENTPSEQIGVAYAVKDGGIKQVVSGATTSGWTDVKVSWKTVTTDNVLKIKYPNNMSAHFDAPVRYNSDEGGLRLCPIADYSVQEMWGWQLVSSTSDTCEYEKDFNGATLNMTAVDDGTYITITFSDAIGTSIAAWTEANIGVIVSYYITDKLPEINYVSSESVMKIWKGTQQEYDAITTKDSSTIYVII